MTELKPTIILEQIRVFTEQALSLTGLSGTPVVVLRHIILIIIAALIAWLSGFICRKLILPAIERLTRHTENKWDDILLNHTVLLSICNIVPAVVIWELLPLVFYQHPVMRELLERATAIYITIMAVRAAEAFIASFNELDTGKRRSSTQQYIKSFGGLLRIAVIFIGCITIVALALGKNPMTLIAGLGATSAVLMLVFKDTIEGLVAGIRLTSNDMVSRSDWITVPGTGANGTVEDITLTTVKVRNFDNTIVTVSPKTLVSGSFQNWIGMQRSDGRRVQRTVYFDFRSIKKQDSQPSDPDGTPQPETNMGQFRHDISLWLSSRPDVNSDMTIMVREMEATQCGLPIEFYFFLRHKVWADYEAHLAEIMEHIYVTAPLYGLTIYQQYPEQ